MRFVPRLQYRFRYYHDDGYDFQEGGENNFVRHRARLGLEAHYESWLSAFMHVQDVRTWGEETNPVTDFSADGFDLHEGYMRIQNPKGSTKLTLGRQTLNYLNQRLVGGLDFAEQARTFDSIRLRALWRATPNSSG